MSMFNDQQWGLPTNFGCAVLIITPLLIAFGLGVLAGWLIWK